jgi:hypothetical protein
LNENPGERLETEAERAKRAVDLLMENYVDDGNNLRKYKEYARFNPDVSKELKPIIDEEITSIQAEYVEDMDAGSLQAILDIPGVEKELEGRFFDKSLDIKSRVIIAQIISDIIYQLIEDEYGVDGFLHDQEKALDDKNNPFYYHIFLRVKTDELKELNHVDYNEEKEIDDQKIAENAYFYQYHEKRVDGFRLLFTPQAAVAINERRGDDYEKEEFSPIRKESHTEEGVEFVSYPGDYLIAQIAPEKYGVFE